MTAGVWQDMLEIITILSVIYNFGLLFFTSHYLQDISWEYRWILFIIAEHFMFAIKYVLSFAIEDSPEDVMIQLERYLPSVSTNSILRHPVMLRGI
jgi:Calcium-activated chloride channel